MAIRGCAVVAGKSVALIRAIVALQRGGFGERLEILIYMYCKMVVNRAFLLKTPANELTTMIIMPAMK